jgi:hypothetical protein
MQEYFDYLDTLRDSGVTNMFGATPYLQNEFEMTRKEASTVLQAWMNQFKKETTNG